MQALSPSSGASALQALASGHGKGQGQGGGQGFAALLTVAAGPRLLAQGGSAVSGRPAAAPLVGIEISDVALEVLQPSASVQVAELPSGMVGEEAGGEAAVISDVLSLPSAEKPPVAGIVVPATQIFVPQEAVDAPVEGEAAAQITSVDEVSRGSAAKNVTAASPSPPTIVGSRVASAPQAQTEKAQNDALQVPITPEADNSKIARSGGAEARPSSVVADAGKPSFVAAPVEAPRVVAAASATVQRAEPVLRNAPAVHGQIAEGVVKAKAAEGGRVTVQLNPHELGKVEVTLVKGDGHHTARIVVDRAETLEVVRSEMRQLERALAEGGMDIRSGSVSVALRGSGAESGMQNRDNGPDGGREASSAFRREEAAAPSSSGPRKLADGRGSKLNISV